MTYSESVKPPARDPGRKSALDKLKLLVEDDSDESHTCLSLSDLVEETHIPANQAQIFRLSGDYNPLHVDPVSMQALESIIHSI